MRRVLKKRRMPIEINAKEGWKVSDEVEKWKKWYLCVKMKVCVCLRKSSSMLWILCEVKVDFKIKVILFVQGCIHFNFSISKPADMKATTPRHKKVSNVQTINNFCQCTFWSLKPFAGFFAWSYLSVNSKHILMGLRSIVNNKYS